MGSREASEPDSKNRLWPSRHSVAGLALCEILTSGSQSTSYLVNDLGLGGPASASKIPFCENRNIAT